MSNLLDARFHADGAVQQTVEITENVRLARDTFRLRFECEPMARRILPGQFVMLRLDGFNDPLIGRPLALYDVIDSAAGQPTSIDVVYLVKGKLTSRLVECRAGQTIEVWGPLGNGFMPQSLEPLIEHLIMVAGGIGQTPFLALARESTGNRVYGDPPRKVAPVKKITLCYGSRSADMLAGVEAFQALGVDVRIATDDGSAGHHGLVTDLLTRTLGDSQFSQHIACCGPEPMMEATAKIAAARDIPCQVSLETPMACGIGICFTCVAKVRDEQGAWDYKRTCVEGPVFAASKIVW